MIILSFSISSSLLNKRSQNFFISFLFFFPSLFLNRESSFSVMLLEMRNRAENLKKRLDVSLESWTRITKRQWDYSMEQNENEDEKQGNWNNPLTIMIIFLKHCAKILQKIYRMIVFLIFVWIWHHCSIFKLWSIIQPRQ
jgi:hypothetical protein